MDIFAIVLSSLALLAAVSSVFLVLDERKRSQKRNTALMRHVEASGKSMEERIKALEKGVVPDFEKAKEAANAVNDFNAGITGILGYDPYSALQAQREKERGGEFN